MNTKRTNLVTASRQWSVRPADERFWTLQELFDRSRLYAEETVVKPVALSQCEIQPYNGEDLALVGPQGKPATFQHYSFGQLCGVAKAPAAYLRELPASLASANLNHGLRQIDGEQMLMFHRNGGLQLRCVTSDKYQRIWNYEVAEMALALQENSGWVIPPARPCGMPDVPVRKAIQADVLRNSAHPTLGIRIGDDISPSGLYVSDHDCFIFQVNENASIDGGDGEQLYRGVFWSNSECGESKFRGTMFLYESICGNHIAWNSKVIAEISIRHVGDARRLFAEAMATVTESVQQSAQEDEARIRAAKQYSLGESQEEIVNWVFRKNLGLSKQECEGAYVLAERHSEEHGNNPHSAWGYAAGITRLSQQNFADKRDVMDRAAGKILSFAF